MLRRFPRDSNRESHLPCYHSSRYFGELRVAIDGVRLERSAGTLTKLTGFREQNETHLSIWNSVRSNHGSLPDVRRGNSGEQHTVAD